MAAVPSPACRRGFAVRTRLVARLAVPAGFSALDLARQAKVDRDAPRRTQQAREADEAAWLAVASGRLSADGAVGPGEGPPLRGPKRTTRAAAAPPLANAPPPA